MDYGKSVHGTRILACTKREHMYMSRNLLDYRCYRVQAATLALAKHGHVVRGRYSIAGNEMTHGS